MAKPTSAFFKAGPSFVPSPVTATTCLCSTAVLSIIPKMVNYTSVALLDYIKISKSLNRIQLAISNHAHFKILPFTNVCLSVGEHLARTRSLGQILSIRSCSI